MAKRYNVSCILYIYTYMRAIFIKISPTKKKALWKILRCCFMNHAFRPSANWVSHIQILAWKKNVQQDPKK